MDETVKTLVESVKTHLFAQCTVGSWAKRAFRTELLSVAGLELVAGGRFRHA